MKCTESSLIDLYFNREGIVRLDVETGIGDDCALIKIPEKHTLAISTDTLVSGRHFLPNINPSDLAYKALAVNISDLAAMGANPAWLTLAITLPEINKIWLKSFSDSLFEQLIFYGVHLIGGDTTAGPLSITMTIHGYVPEECALKRVGAKPGDWICITGTLGDSAAGLAILQNKLKVMDKNDANYLIKRHLRPVPRVFHGKNLRNLASSAIDLSDGLITDLRHILKASKVGACIDLDLLPLSLQMRKHVESNQAIQWALSGGEDYELCFTVSEVNYNVLRLAFIDFETKFTCIGRILPESEGLQFIRNRVPFVPVWKNYNHFE